MARPSLRPFLRDLDRDPGSLRMLVAACLSLLASGLAPRILSPGLESVQAAVRARPEAEVLLLVAAVLGAGMLLVGGVLGDADGRKRILRWALAALVVSEFTGLVVTEGPLFLIAQFIGIAGASVILPMAFAGIAMRYQGIPRATAIGIAYGAYGAATAASPVLLSLFGPGGSRWPAYLAAAIAALVALSFVRTAWEDLPVTGRGQRVGIVATAIWAFGIVVITAGIIGFQGSQADLVRLAFVVIGGVVLVAGLALERWRRRAPGTSIQVDRRSVAVALFVGFVLAYAQSAALLQVPLYFQLVLGYGPVLSVIATIPFMAALVVAGPVAGILLGRIRPRTLVVLGTVAVGAGNELIAFILRPSAAYPGFALSFLLIGAGFVIATTVRTAIIFASVPRGLPATAAALNEASVSLGSRAGLTVTTLLITTLALDSYAASLVGRPAGEIYAAVDAFRTLLVAIGLPQYGSLVVGLGTADAAAYATAYTDAVRTVLLSTGLVALIAAPIAWIALGRRDPLRTVWDHRDERTGDATDLPISG
jgi:MFS family permease